MRSVLIADAILTQQLLHIQPDDAPAVKVRAVQEYGATVTHTPIAVREDTVARVVAETGMTEIHSSNNPCAYTHLGVVCSPSPRHRASPM